MSYGYSVSDIRPMLAEWQATLSDTDLAECAETGNIYKRAEAELQEALYQAGYNPTTSTPLAYQRCHDILCSGIALYFAEGHTSTTYPDGYNPIAGGFARYRAVLRDIAAGGQLGELSQKTSHGVAAAHFTRCWR